MTTINPAPHQLRLDAQIRSKGSLKIERRANRDCQFFVGDSREPVCTVDWQALEQLRQFLNEILDADPRAL